MLLLFDVTDTPPLLVCETLTVFELVDDAEPLVTDAVDEPVLDPLFVFDAVPPVLPAVLPLESPPPPMSPPLADAFAPWWLELHPETLDVAELYPEFASEDWSVHTLDFCFRISAPIVGEPSGSALLNVLPDESELTVAPPELSCVTSAEFVLPDVASPEPAVADDVPLFVPVFPFVAVPPVLPAVLPDESSGSLPMFPSLAEPSAHWWLWFSPFTDESEEL